ncbi:acyl-CoA dehydrogenase/oxidase C-terminal [Polychytrium aggregatum]|uniref:acyl-CoA dehydrogenase/oxidase C-terminal n=1 Tax=Polychytrium aggregatum TaxID=110093 RepID=UPI0022FDB375|nr:acyl-CoA dehydrogenase/oxidase C-terminal [Polychytrium aggregatum]KAI9199240.1 acyl-CoA dehydrogenase/oxidase C-terminal [Polychytrium aggregatum]
MSTPAPKTVISPQSSLQEERLRATFPVREMTYFLDGGEKQTELKERLSLQLERDPIFKVEDHNDLTFDEIRERTMAKVRRAAHFVSSEPVSFFKIRLSILSLVDPGTWTRIGVHYGLFFGALQGQATPEQFAFWVQKGAVALNGLIGCYAMTELGHGSNVAGLETTATYDEASDEFVIHTPTLTATKWWIGGAAQSATHSCVYAQLIVKGKCYGVKTFIVPLRDPKTFALRPGVVIGDIGAKMGRHGTDNGWIQFTHVRIPRSYMLMRHAKVSRAGVVTEPPLAQLAYGALIQGRVTMVVDSGNISKKALTIALRYAAIRRQFGAKAGEPETKLLDYIIHQHRLLPLLAQAFAMHFTGVEVYGIYEKLNNAMQTLKPGDKNLQTILEQLKEVHGTSAGLKAFCTWNALATIEQCRQACGGHGYSSYTGLASLYSDFAVQCTWEGDNTILTLQAGRYLIGCYRDAKKGKIQHGGVAYLNNLTQVLSARCQATQPDEIQDLETIGNAYNLVSANLVKKAGDEFESLRAKGLKEDEAYEECSHSRLAAAKMHSYGYLFHRFKDGINKAPASLKPILLTLCRLYGLYNIQENAGAFLQYQYFSGQQLDWVKGKVSELCKIVRNDAIALCDSFNFSDYVINSPLGRYDGNIYEAYFNTVNRAHKAGAVPKYFDREIYPLLHRKLTDDERIEMEHDE